MGRVLPILFNGDMVRAILDGRKTVTRRVIRFPVNSFTGRIPIADDVRVSTNTLWSKEVSFFEGSVTFGVRPPYGIGDILYVRETWHKYKKRVGHGENCRLREFYGYKASIANSEDASEKWRPSIHMPKQAARIWLKVTDVRAERLKDIDALGCQREGVDITRNGVFKRFSSLWESSIRKEEIDRYGWDANPWVWVIEFERCEKPEREG
ncbi:hypothetical protein [Acetatifactor aquisgranensis]|uniref:hypothetical protein n=1 Tax=Acetatifactor aquisgranensis TaxID=2941233 RepID=UPI00203A92C0|nr:hypothetical protein [Acetatifactor aquisgranensis]